MLVENRSCPSTEKAQIDAQVLGLNLVVFDCYRPQRAVLSFINWAATNNEATKKNFIQMLKRKTFEQGYIAEKSMHSTGLAVDIGIKGLNFGTPFDFLGKSLGQKILEQQK